MAMLTPQEQQMVMNIPPGQRPQAVVALVQQKQARQQAQQQQQRFGGAGGELNQLGFVPNNGATAQAGAYANRQAPQQPGMGLQLPGMLGQQGQQQPQQGQQHSINPFTGGSTNPPQYRF